MQIKTVLCDWCGIKEEAGKAEYDLEWAHMTSSRRCGDLGTIWTSELDMCKECFEKLQPRVSVGEPL